MFDGMLQVPADYRGEIELTYRTRPPVVRGDDDEEIIEMPSEYYHLVALLAAYHYRLDEDEATALHFKEEYENLFKLMESQTYETMDNEYKVENGWA